MLIHLHTNFPFVPSSVLALAHLKKKFLLNINLNNKSHIQKQRNRNFARKEFIISLYFKVPGPLFLFIFSTIFSLIKKLIISLFLSIEILSWDLHYNLLTSSLLWLWWGPVFPYGPEKNIQLGIVKDKDKMHQTANEVISFQSIIAIGRTFVNESISVIRKEIWNFIKTGMPGSHLHVLWESWKWTKNVLSESLRKMKVGLILEHAKARWSFIISQFSGKQKDEGIS